MVATTETAADAAPPVAAQADPQAEPQVRADAEEKLAAAVSSLAVNDEGVQPHRSHDPQFNQKRSDPFQFGSRFLEDGDDPFEFNAWDHVETDDAFKEFAEQQYDMQRQSPVSDFDKRKLPITQPLRTASLHCKHRFCDDLHL